ncbi:hypothetical protein SAMN05443637_11946 [Pseudonocardia thermophila]|uniref:DUF3592 domain-containing protein n=1 Tax=Pseudonocardia thermophila TaxID=1848 RepID=A0A1M6Y8I3_PSETH|nr:DUF3592 domain-containing protein [Pseudonocardia thermophila]SHL14493.1 hypothetical protein SAMN05443637_11946 [Pseudonocardia thermophila]
MTGTPQAGPPSAGATVTKLADEFADLVRPVVRLFRARAAEFVAGLALLITALAVFAVAGAAVDDRKIEANLAVAQAEVLEGSSFTRTLVRFTTATGETVVPADGVAYPRGTQIGETIFVEYDSADPDLVRVAGRTALSQSGPLALAVLVTWVLLGPLAWWLKRKRGTAA